MVVLRAGRNLLNFILHQTDNFLVVQAVPYTVARVDNKFIIGRTVNHKDVGIGGNSLIPPVEHLRVLVLVVTEGSAQRQVAVDTLVADIMAGLLDTSLLHVVLRLVVLAESNGGTSSTENGTAITSVGAENLFGRDENDAGGRAGILSILLVLDIVVDIMEALDERIFVVLFLEFNLRYEILRELILGELCNFLTTMAVEYTEKHGITVVIRQSDLIGNMSVLHATAPALHADSSPVSHVGATRLRCFVRNGLI